MSVENQGHQAKGGKARISNEQLAKLAHDLASEPRFAGFVGPEVVIACILDLADARARIRELEALSDSQEVKS